MENAPSAHSRAYQGSYRIEYQPQLIEEAVLRAIAGHLEEERFRQERDTIYELADLENREKRFQQLHERWFNQLGLVDPMRKVFELWPILKTSTQRCLLVKARSNKEMGADLHVALGEPNQPKREQRTILVKVTPELFCQSFPFLNFLRHEILHIVDMVDPNFGYEPDFPKTASSPVYGRFLQERYRVLWDITVDGRLYQKGWLPSSARESHWRIFKRTFSGSEKDLELVFSYFFDQESPAHRELILFAQHPEEWLTGATTPPTSKGQCSLCRFPSFHLINPVDLSAGLLAQICKEQPTWNAREPVCPQCVDLYKARHSMTKMANY
jgi:hypothetical protein